VRPDRERLLDIVDAITAIERHQPSKRADFDENELVRVWCLRHVEIVGEAAAKVSADTRALTHDIPWRQIVGMRNALVHAYFDVDWTALWNVLERDIQPLKAAILRLLEKVPNDSASE
jgi:uncharacterized protein with HEPN domain